MADENLYSLLIRVEGGDLAAAEIIKSKYALKQVRDEASSPFEHAGVYLFSRQLFGLVGLSDLARHALMGINAAVEATASSFGVAMSTVGPLLLAIGATVAVYEMYEKGAGKASKATEEFAQKQKSAFDATISLNEQIKKTADELGALPTQYKKAADAARDLQEARTGEVRKTAQEQIEANNKIIETNQRKIDSLKESTKYAQAELAAGDQFILLADGNKRSVLENAEAVKKLETANRELHDRNVLLAADASAQGQGVKDLADKLAKLEEAHKKAAEAAKKHAEEEQKASDAIRAAAREEAKEIEEASKKQEEALTSLTQKTKILFDEQSDGIRSAYEKRAAEIKKFEDEQSHAIEETYRKGKEEAEKFGLDTTSIEQQRALALEQLHRTVATKERENLTEMEAAWKRYGNQVANDIAQSTARILVDHATVGDEIKAISKMMAEQLIADMVRAGIQHTVMAIKRMGEDTAVAAHQNAVSSAATAAEITRITTVAAAKKAADLAAVAAMEAQTATAVQLTAALTACTAAAIALDAALAGAA